MLRCIEQAFHPCPVVGRAQCGEFVVSALRIGASLSLLAARTSQRGAMIESPGDLEPATDGPELRQCRIERTQRVVRLTPGDQHLPLHPAGEGAIVGRVAEFGKRRGLFGEPRRFVDAARAQVGLRGAGHDQV